MSQRKRGSVNPRFQVGDKVRVKPGISDPDLPDMPLGGWSGTITEIIQRQGQINELYPPMFESELQAIRHRIGSWYN